MNKIRIIIRQQNGTTKSANVYNVVPNQSSYSNVTYFDWYIPDFKIECNDEGWLDTTGIGTRFRKWNEWSSSNQMKLRLVINKKRRMSKRNQGR